MSDNIQEKIIVEDDESLVFNLVEIGVTTSVTRKVPLEQFGSTDFFSSASHRIAIENPHGLTLSEVLDKTSSIRRNIVNRSFANCMRDVALEVLVTRAIRDGLSPKEAVEYANSIGTFEKVIEVVAQGK